MHRDYSHHRTQISVEVYDDRVEIINPGGCPRGLSMKFGKVSVRRNELIADLFFDSIRLKHPHGNQKMKDVMAAVGFARRSSFRRIFSCHLLRLPEFALKESHAATDATARELRGGYSGKQPKKLPRNYRKKNFRTDQEILPVPAKNWLIRSA